MKVLEIIASGDVGGGTIHVLQILRGLRDKMSLHLVTQRDSYLFEKAREIGIPCYGLDFFAGRLDLRVSVGLHKIITSVCPHVVHVHGGRAAFFLALARSAVPSAYTVHGFHFSHKPFPARWLARCAEGFALSRAHHVIFVSQFDQKLAAGECLLSGKTSNSVIHNGIAFPSVWVREEGQQHLIGFVGRLEPQKDPLLFLKSLEELSGYRGVIVGTGSLEQTVRTEIERRLLQDRVTLLGGLSHEETMRAMEKFQILVMTSRWEGLPLIALEAMRMGIPVVATNVGGMSEVIEDGRSGVLVSSRTSTAIARAVKRISENEGLRATLVKEARTRIGEKFSEERMLTKVEEVYERIAHTTPVV